MFNSVSLQSIRSHASTTINLDRLTVFVGPNGTGKSTVLGMIERTAAHLRSALRDNSGREGERFEAGYAVEKLARRGENSCGCTLVGHAARPWSARIEWNRAAHAWIMRDSLADDSLSDALISPNISDKLDAVAAWRERLSTVWFALDPSRIAYKNSVSSSSSQVRGDGFYTVIALLHLAQRRNKTAYDAVVHAIQQLVPSLQNVRAVVTTGNDAGVQLVYDFSDAEDVFASAVSEGTLLATALLTALYGDDQPRVLLLDDIERGLHPTAQLRFMQQLKALLDAQPQLQIIATTHSPFILDALAPSQVRVFARRKDGSVAIKSLAEHPMAKENEGALTTGQLWSLDDESRWVLRPEERGQ